MAIGMVIATMNSDHGALCMALTQARDKPASVRIRINKTANPAIVPVNGSISLSAMVARLSPLWRTEAKITTIS